MSRTSVVKFPIKEEETLESLCEILNQEIKVSARLTNRQRKIITDKLGKKLDGQPTESLDNCEFMSRRTYTRYSFEVAQKMSDL
jgi:hypothetical protein